MGFPLHHSALLQSGLDVCAWGPISHCYPRQDRNRDLVGRLCVQVRMEELAILTWVPGNLNLRPGFGKIHSEIPGRWLSILVSQSSFPFTGHHHSHFPFWRICHGNQMLSHEKGYRNAACSWDPVRNPAKGETRHMKYFFSWRHDSFCYVFIDSLPSSPIWGYAYTHTLQRGGTCILLLFLLDDLPRSGPWKSLPAHFILCPSPLSHTPPGQKLYHLYLCLSRVWHRWWSWTEETFALFETQHLLSDWRAALVSWHLLPRDNSYSSYRTLFKCHHLCLPGLSPLHLSSQPLHLPIPS